MGTPGRTHPKDPREDPDREFPYPVCPVCGEPVVPVATISVQMEWNPYAGGYMIDMSYLHSLEYLEANEEAVSTMDDEVECDNGHKSSTREVEEAARRKATGPTASAEDAAEE